MHLRVGSRRSALARAQAFEVVQALKAKNSHLEVEWVWFVTQGDRLRHRFVRDSGGKELFTKELEEALSQGLIDLAIHSGKDLPSRLPQGLKIAATPRRATPYDLILSREPLDFRKRLKVGTSSLRRAVQIHERYPHWEIVPLRGNLDTRWRRVERGELDLIVVAEAGVERLWGSPPGYSKRAHWMLPAPCQGILAIEVAESSHFLFPILERIHDPDTGIVFACERKVMELVGGGCTLPFAALAKKEGEEIFLTAKIWDEGWKLKGSFTGVAPASDAFSLAKRAAHKLLGMPFPENRSR